MNNDTVEIISDAEIDRIHASAYFGSMSNREVVNQAVLRCACGFHSGRTATAIIAKHGLVDEKYELTAKGRCYLWAAFGDKDD